MLSIQNLNKTYTNGIHAINDISLEISTGLFGLLGPNGAGKSSLMRTIATLQEPDSGSIHFNNVDVLKDKDCLRRRLGYLPQDFGVYPKVNALDLLRHFATLKGVVHKVERQEMVESLLCKTNLWKVRKHPLSTFSGGMLRRFGIAQALIGSPHLVIVDEPTAGLDPDERNRFLNLLSEISEDATVILSTHIVEEVAQLCPQMAMVTNGKVIAHGDPQTVINALQRKVWRKRIHKNALLEYQNQYIVLSSCLVSGQPQIHVFSEFQPDDGFIMIEPDLEDAYFLLLRQNNCPSIAQQPARYV